MGRVYRNPPLVEVICEFRFEPGVPWDITIPGSIYERVKQAGFHKRQSRRGVAFSHKGQGEAELGFIDHILFLREDERAFFQVSENLLAVNHLSPYPTWEKFLPLIRQSFDVYTEVAQPLSINRIGLRYINRIEAPEEQIELSEYFSFYPTTGTDLPQNYFAFLLETHSSFNDERDVLKINLQSISDAEGRAIILDLDYFLIKPGAIPLNESFLWVEHAHAKVEQAFEGCITAKLRAQFEEVPQA